MDGTSSLSYISLVQKVGKWGRIELLLVDDNHAVRRSVRHLIHAKTSFRVVAEARSGREALELLRVSRPDVVVTDVEMPGIDGVELTREIKRLYPFIHVLALTSTMDDGTKEKMRDAGASGYIVKPKSEHLVYALNVAHTIGADRRRADRPRAIQSIWHSQ